MKRFLKFSAGVLVVGAALAGIVAGTVWLASSKETRAAIEQALFGPYPDGRDPSWHTPAADELLRANTEHYLIALTVSRCFKGVKFYWGNEGPPTWLVTTFMLNMQPNGELIFGGDMLTPAEASPGKTPLPDDPANNPAAGKFPTAYSSPSRMPPPDVQLTNLQRSILNISREASLARAEFAGSASNSRSDMLFYQWMIVIVGALTTILVSIKSMSNGTEHGRAYFIVGILAVVFSACGTALASMNSFLSPNDNYVRSERALLQVRQLHWELAQIVAQNTDLCVGYDPTKADDPRGKQLTDLSTRLKELIASSGVSGNASSGTSVSTGSSSSSGRVAQ